MVYHAVGKRCAVCFKDLDLPISEKKCLTVLQKKGFSVVPVDIVVLARKCVGQAKYCRGAKLSEAPKVFDCSSFTKWLYGQLGIWLPRRSIQQRSLGFRILKDDLRAGDLVFVSGYVDYYLHDSADGVGHVGIATENMTVVHAANKKVNLIESSFESFVDGGKFRGIRRFMPENERLYTLITPPHREIEWSDDLRWIILQNLPR